MLLLWLACSKNPAPPVVPSELRWRTHTTTRVDRMDVTVHQVAEVAQRSRPVEAGTEVLQTGTLLDRTAQTSFGRLEPGQLAQLPGLPELRFVIDDSGAIVQAAASDGKQNELVAAFAHRLQSAPVPRVEVGERWSRSETVDLQIDGPEGAPVPFRVALDIQGERQPAEGPGELHALTSSLRIVGSTRRLRVVSLASLAACTQIHSTDRHTLISMLRMRAIVIAGDDDRSPTTMWMHHRTERLGAELPLDGPAALQCQSSPEPTTQGPTR